MAKKIDRHFVSELDQFLGRFDHANPSDNPAVKQEIEKAKQIHKRRDAKIELKEAADIFEDFQ